jgi:aminomethyltransferase
MVEFAGYLLPLHYRAGIIGEHLHTRSSASLFDVSHMGQAFLGGADPATAFERLTPVDVSGLRGGQMRYGLLLTDHGGIRDDLMIGRLPVDRRLFLVVNAATKHADHAYISERLAGTLSIEPQHDRALLALQGPKSEQVLSRHSEAIAALGFMKIAETSVAGAPAIVSRSGYTGEDGFEISVAASHAENVARALLGEPEVAPAGLGARDTLRLEAGLCLYGHDIDASTTPVEADLVWTIGKRRKLARDFPGAERILQEVLDGPRRKRVGLRLMDRTPAREDAVLLSPTSENVGRVTSGGFSPTAGMPIAMAYVNSEFAADGTELAAVVRGKPRVAVVSPLPFVPHRYRRRNE